MKRWNEVNESQHRVVKALNHYYKTELNNNLSARQKGSEINTWVGNLSGAEQTQFWAVLEMLRG